MKKKILGLMFVLFMLCAFMPVIASAAESGTCGANGDNLTWTLDEEGTLTISGEGDMKDDYYSYYDVPWYNSRSSITKVVIDQDVTSIGDYAFYGCDGVTSITIPDSVTNIGNSAFKYCGGLTSVTIGSSVTSIGESAFFGCDALDSAYISDLTAYLNIDFGSADANPMYYAYKLYLNGRRVAGNLQIPVGITKIPCYAFAGCDGIKSVTIPNTVVSIGAYAFRDCGGLTSFDIPDNVTSISSSAFRGCLQCNVYYNGSYKDFINILSGDSESSNANLYCDDLTAIIWGKCGDTVAWFFGDNNTLTISGAGDMEDYSPSSFSSTAPWSNFRIKEAVIEQGVTHIGNDAFYYCNSLTSVTIGRGVTSIGSGAFYKCAGLKDVYITDIAKWCEIKFDEYYTSPMYYADNMYINDVLTTDLVIPNDVTSIGDYAFEYCGSLTSVTIPDSVTSIGNSAFSDCSGLTSVTIPDSVTSIGNSAFSDCSGLTSITIPNSVTSIGNSAFSDCSGLTSITIPNSVTSIGNSAFSDCNGLTSITIPNSVTSIGEYAFCCNGLTSVNYNASKVFSNIFGYNKYNKYNNNILLIVLGNNVKSIDPNAFTGCVKLKRIIIPKSVTEIDKAAFKDCTSLSTVEYGGSETDWNEMYIGTENENLKNVEIHYNSPFFVSDNMKLTSPTITLVEDETTRTFTVEIEQPVIGSYVYAVTYDANDMPLNISKVPLNLFEPTAVVVDKSDNDNYAKIFVWTDEMQPLTYVKSVELQ